MKPRIVTGPNGSGKSTLLSIICADIPQAYACDVTLFDRPRGSGESIWDIKRHIGYVSPELLILDEPMHGLDDENGDRVRKITDAFCSREGKSLIMVSHYPEDFPACISHHLKLA